MLTISLRRGVFIRIVESIRWLPVPKFRMCVDERKSRDLDFREVLETSDVVQLARFYGGYNFLNKQFQINFLGFLVLCICCVLQETICTQMFEFKPLSVG